MGKNLFLQYRDGIGKNKIKKINNISNFGYLLHICASIWYENMKLEKSLRQKNVQQKFYMTFSLNFCLSTCKINKAHFSFWYVKICYFKESKRVVPKVGSRANKGPQKFVYKTYIDHKKHTFEQTFIIFRSQHRVIGGFQTDVFNL